MDFLPRTTKATRALDYAAQLNFPKSLAIAVRLAERASLSVWSPFPSAEVTFSNHLAMQELASRIDILLNKKAEQLHPKPRTNVEESRTATELKTKQPTQVEEEEGETQLPPRSADGATDAKKSNSKKRTREEAAQEDEVSDEEDSGKEDEDEDDLSDYERETKRHKREEARMQEAQQTSNKPATRRSPEPLQTDSEKNLLTDLFGTEPHNEESSF